jgi:mannosyltransferase
VPPMQRRLDANLADRATLLGYDLEPEAVRPGETLRLTLYWRAGQPMSRSYAVFTHLLDAEDRIVAQHDGLPADWTRPTTGWLPGEVITDVHELVLRTDIPPAPTYLLEVGLYDSETNVRLPVLGAAGQTIGDRVLLTPVSGEP